VAWVRPGDVVRLDTHDARSGALLDRLPGTPFPLPLPTPGAGNPVTGPVYVEGARPGDALVVDVLSIECGPVGWCGGHAHVGAVPAGRVPEAVGRTCRVTPEGIEFGPGIVLPLRPMIGCIGTAPLAPLGTHAAGRHGGNLDHTVVGVGTTVMLPVSVDGALLSIGDVHAAQGDGELSGVALEVPASVTVRVRPAPGAAPAWPWVLTADVVAVMTTAETFERATELAVDEAMTLLEQSLGLTPGDALALASVACSVKVGALWGGPLTTARVEVPRSLGALPAGLAEAAS
jgi:amidase